MSQDSLPSRSTGGPAPFRAVLTPYRSLSPAGFLVLMGAIGLVSFATGIGFLMVGAWPVLGFFGLDVALIYLAFRLNYRSGRRLETIEIEDGRLTLTRIDPLGRRRSTALHAAWVDVRLRQARDGRTALTLASHGREHPFGAFLTDDERREFADVLRGALVAARGGPRI
jgi:uncharacterized membrane protein